MPPNAKEVTGVIDLTREKYCHFSEDKSFGRSFLTAVGGLIAHVGPVICGGQDHFVSEPGNQCYLLNSKDFKDVRMLQSRTNAASVTFYNGTDDSSLFIAGGKTGLGL